MEHNYANSCAIQSLIIGMISIVVFPLEVWPTMVFFYFHISLLGLLCSVAFGMAAIHSCKTALRYDTEITKVAKAGRICGFTGIILSVLWVLMVICILNKF